MHISGTDCSQVKLIEHKHERVRESDCIRLQTARESNLENRTRRSKIKCIGISVIRNCPITDNYMFLHDKNNQSDNNYNFLHGNKITSQITITSFARISPMQLQINYMAPIQ